MLNTQNLRTAALALVTTAMLVGCTSQESSEQVTSPAPQPSPTEQARPDMRLVTILDVVDPLTVRVTPKDETDELYGTEFILHLTDITVPDEGECGYEEVVAFAETELAGEQRMIQYESVTDGVYIDGNGDHHGFLGTSNQTNYDSLMLQAGYAYLTVPDEPEWLAMDQQTAKDESAGLWASCPGFGQ